MFVTHLLFCKHVILYILYILYTCVMHCDKFLCCWFQSLHQTTAVKIWAADEYGNLKFYSTCSLRNWFHEEKKKFIDLYLKTCFLHSSPDAFPKGRVSIPGLLPLQLSALTLQAAQQLKISPRFSFPCTIFRR